MSGPTYINKDGDIERECLDGTPRTERLVWSSADRDEAWWEDPATIDYEAARRKATDILLNDASLLADPYPAIVNAAIGITT